MKRIKRSLITLLTLSALVVASVGFVGCEGGFGTGSASSESSSVDGSSGSGNSDSSDSSVHTHVYIESVLTEAGCETAGVMQYTCGCGDTYTDTIAPTGHEEVPHDAKESTCVERGWNAYVTCENCAYTTKVELPFGEHKEVPHDAKASTCEEAGWDAYVTCEICPYTTKQDLPLADHAFADGFCSVCNGKDADYAYSVGLEYQVFENQTCSVIGIGTCEDEIIKIPTTYQGATVTTIADNAFKQCEIKGVEFPNTLQTIGEYAFAWTKVAEVTLPDGLTGLWSYAFYECKSLTKINIPEGVTVIMPYAFSGCTSLEDFTWHDNITNVYESGFEKCRELDIKVWPSQLKTISKKAFTACFSLTRVVLSANMTRTPVYGEGEEAAFYQCYQLTEVYNQTSLTISRGSDKYGYVGYYAVNVTKFANSLGTFTVDENGYEIYTAPWYKVVMGYQGTDTELTLPADTTHVQCGAFYREGKINKTITKVTFPASVKEIGDYAFTHCYALTTVVIPKDSLLTVIDRFAFYDCGELTSIYLPSKLTMIGDYAFRHCVKLATVYDASTALNIYAGSESNGYVGKYATNVVYVTE